MLCRKKKQRKRRRNKTKKTRTRTATTPLTCGAFDGSGKESELDVGERPERERGVVGEAEGEMQGVWDLSLLNWMLLGSSAVLILLPLLFLFLLHLFSATIKLPCACRCRRFSFSFPSFFAHCLQ